jgi:hypothetical protein
MKKHIKSITSPNNKEKLSKFSFDKEQISALTLCQYEDKPKTDCLERVCETCSTNRIVDYFQDVKDESKDRDIVWYHWGPMEVIKDSKVKKIVSCQSKYKIAKLTMCKTQS